MHNRTLYSAELVGGVYIRRRYLLAEDFDGVQISVHGERARSTRFVLTK